MKPATDDDSILREEDAAITVVNLKIVAEHKAESDAQDKAAKEAFEELMRPATLT